MIHTALIVLSTLNLVLLCLLCWVLWRRERRVPALDVVFDKDGAHVRSAAGGGANNLGGGPHEPS